MIKCNVSNLKFFKDINISILLGIHNYSHLLKYNYLVIREYGSTLYVGLARAVSPNNTKFRLTFLLTRLQEALYEDLAV